jgi:threonine dehydrogenase-like Zn-dependent dehydrogenase
MKVLWKYPDGALGFRQINEPFVLEPDDVKIKVLYSTIGAEDMRMYREGDYYSKEGVAGYEACGTIVELGEQAKREGFSVGQRVSGTPVLFCGQCSFCKRKKENCCVAISLRVGTLCEYIVWKTKQLVPLEDTISDKFGSLVEPVAVALQTVERMHIQMGDSVCIFGADFVGLILLQLARMRGATEITVLDPLKSRRDLVLALGANHFICLDNQAFNNQLMKITGFNGFDAIVITSGEFDLFGKAFEALAKGGQLLLTQYYELGKPVLVDTMNLFFQNATISSSFLYTQDKLELAARLLPSLRVKELVSTEFSFDQALAAFEAEKKGFYPRVGIKF